MADVFIQRERAEHVLGCDCAAVNFTQLNLSTLQKFDAGNVATDTLCAGKFSIEKAWALWNPQ